MLNIFYGRENLNKTKFIFDSIEGKTLIIVPDQFTLEAERDAFFYLQKKALIDVDVMGFSRLGDTVIQKTGGKVNLIGREGRQMLLSRIIKKHSQEMEVFKGSSDKMEFIQLVHDLISDFKQHNTDPQSLKKAIDEIEDEGILKKKLSEILTVFEEYEKSTEGKYLDNEDYISLYISKINKADFIKESHIWIYGFDSFTEKNISVISELSAYAKSVNVVITYDESHEEAGLFDIGKMSISKLEKTPYFGKKEEIDCKYKADLTEDILALENSLYREPFDRVCSGGKVKTVKAANTYSEAASAAVYILSLIRDKGYRLKDIALINNDIENCGSLYKRVFAEYGIDLFIDSKRSVLYHPAVNYILSLMDVTSKNFQKEDVLRLIKTDLVCQCDEDIEEIEVYAKKYDIRGKRWKVDFTRGISQYDEETLEHLNDVRKQITEPIIGFEEKFKSAVTAKEKTETLYEFLEKEVHLPEKMKELVKLQEEKGLLEVAEETAQIWNTVSNLFEQIVEVLGDEKISKKEFGEIVKTGFEAVEIGVIPPAADGLIMGTMQRTRRGHIKATVITGAAEGVLPRSQEESGILNEDERLFLSDNNISICKLAQVKILEENVAIYRNIAKTEDELYISYSVSDSEGKAVEPSNIFTKIGEIFEDVKSESDIFNDGDVKKLLGGTDATKNNLAEFIVHMSKEDENSSLWQEVYRWFSQREEIDKLSESLLKVFGEKNISADTVAKLFKKNENGDFVVSPSRLEKFGRCPFEHFVSYGLRPEENREYKIGAPEAGTVYHRCIKEVSEEISRSNGKNMNITDENSHWMTVTRDEVDEKVTEVLKNISEEYMEGILSENNYEKYRAQRIEKVCADSMWMVVKQVRKGAIKNMDFEVNFGKYGKLPPIVLNTESEKVSVEGQIDRWDLLDGDYSKVIDYKSGSDEYVEKEAKAGIKLQLFIYLMATLKDSIKPAGAFYFHLDEAKGKNAAKIEDEIDNQYKMSGFALNDERVAKALDSDGGRFGKVYKKGQGVLKQEEFDKLLGDVFGKIEEMAKQITEGEIGIKPKKVGQKESCTYCPYNGICKFDLSIEDCRYNMV